MCGQAAMNETGNWSMGGRRPLAALVCVENKSES
jgi:hypothetical protein